MRRAEVEVGAGVTDWDIRCDECARGTRGWQWQWHDMEVVSRYVPPKDKVPPGYVSYLGIGI